MPNLLNQLLLLILSAEHATWLPCPPTPSRTCTASPPLLKNILDCGFVFLLEPFSEFNLHVPDCRSRWLLLLSAWPTSASWSPSSSSSSSPSSPLQMLFSLPPSTPLRSTLSSPPPSVPSPSLSHSSPSSASPCPPPLCSWSSCPFHPVRAVDWQTSWGWADQIGLEGFLVTGASFQLTLWDWS